MSHCIPDHLIFIFCITRSRLALTVALALAALFPAVADITDISLSPSPPPPSCSYVGTYKISSLSAPCNNHFLSYSLDCGSAKVRLRKPGQLYPRLQRSFWKINAPAEGPSAPIKPASRKGCPSSVSALASPPNATKIALGRSSWKWFVRPAGDGSDCSVVNLISPSSGFLTMISYLSVPNTCDRFKWASAENENTSFKLTRIGNAVVG